MSIPSRRLLLLFFLPFLGRSEEDCGVHNWRRALGHQQKDDFIIYGITQDCQIFFARSSQLGSLAQIRTNPGNNYCFPNLIQLQLIDNSTLRLLIKQHGNRICVLTINIPPLNILFGANAFTYSLSSSMPYARCSHSAPDFSLEADLAFPDSAYSDVVYFVDPTSSGPSWTARQFMLNENDTFSLLNHFIIHNGDRTGYSTALANEFVLSLDAEKNFLFKRHHFRRDFSYECAFDLLFRPKSVVFGASHSSVVDSVNERSSWLNSIAVDKEMIIFAETDKQSPVAPTRLYVQSTQGGNTLAHCIGQLPYRVELGIFSMRTMENLTHKPLPKFGIARNAPPRLIHPRPHSGGIHSTTTEKASMSRPEVPPVVHTMDGARTETSSRLTQKTTTTRRTTTSTMQSTTRESTAQYPEEPPDESEDIGEEEAAVYDTEAAFELESIPSPARITGVPTSPPPGPAPVPASEQQVPTWPTTQIHHEPTQPTQQPTQPTGSPLNDTLQSKSALACLSLISTITLLAALLSIRVV